MPEITPIKTFESSCPYLPTGGNEGDTIVRTDTNKPYTASWQKLIAFVDDETALVPPGVAGTIVFVKDYQASGKPAVAFLNPETATYEILISGDPPTPTP